MGIKSEKNTENFYIFPALYKKRRKEFFEMLRKRKEFNTIDVECDGWRSWERLGNEVLDWEGVINRCGGGHADFVGRCDFSVSLYAKPRYAGQIYERIKKYPGTIKIIWSNGFVIVEKCGC